MSRKPFIYLGLIVLACVLGTFAMPAETSANHRQRFSSSLRRKINELGDKVVQNIPIPVLLGVAPHHIYPDFGDPRSGGRKHEGQDILAPRGAPVVTPTDAVVLRTGEGESSGNYVYTANPGGETFAYMHLDEIAEIDSGDELKRGDLLGYVGNTGNAAGGPAHLHFEIRINGQTDPYPRLKSTFTISEKMEYLAEILEDAEDDKKLAEFIVRTYPGELALARAGGIALHSLLVAATPLTAPASSGDLKLGSRGPAVLALQRFLKDRGVGSGVSLVPDGAFGPRTERALAEYQASVGISPARGYYGPKTRAYILANFPGAPRET